MYLISYIKTYLNVFIYL